MSNFLCSIFGHKPRTEYNAELSGYEGCWHRTYCQRCGIRLNSAPKTHQWVDGRLENPCEYGNICQNCGYIIGGHFRHEFDQEHPVHEGCAVHTVCKLCGASSQVEFEHHYGEEPVLEGCMSFRVCQRCGQRNSVTPSHDYGAPIQKGCVVSKTCTRCSHQVVETLHDYKRVSSRESEVAHMLTTWTTYVCEKCGEEKVEESGRYTDW